jgi:hypothetical protein
MRINEDYLDNIDASELQSDVDVSDELPQMTADGWNVGIFVGFWGESADIEFCKDKLQKVRRFLDKFPFDYYCDNRLYCSADDISHMPEAEVQPKDINVRNGGWQAIGYVFLFKKFTSLNYLLLILFNFSNVFLKDGQHNVVVVKNLRWVNINDRDHFNIFSKGFADSIELPTQKLGDLADAILFLEILNKEIKREELYNAMKKFFDDKPQLGIKFYGKWKLIK